MVCISNKLCFLRQLFILQDKMWHFSISGYWIIKSNCDLKILLFFKAIVFYMTYVHNNNISTCNFQFQCHMITIFMHTRCKNIIGYTVRQRKFQMNIFGTCWWYSTATYKSTRISVNVVLSMPELLFLDSYHHLRFRKQVNNFKWKPCNDGC
jgi:hypothetical protein